MVGGLFPIFQHYFVIWIEICVTRAHLRLDYLYGGLYVRMSKDGGLTIPKVIAEGFL